MTGFKLSNIQKAYGLRQVLNGINLDVAENTFVSIVGASGDGKSTLLRLIAGLESPTKGEVHFPNVLRKSFVFQEANLLDWRNVYENVNLAFELDAGLQEKTSKTEIAEIVNGTLELVQLSRYATSFPHELSGGMKMRVSIARALANSPQLLLMDEPFAALDDNTRFELQIRLREITKQKKLNVLFVTHNIAEAVFLSDRIVQIKDGRIGLDREIPLGNIRDNSLRTSASYLEELQNIYRELL